MRTVETITTSDGVALGYVRRGSGPPLVLVHGGGTDHHCFDPLLPGLTARFETIAYDRRGRGSSGGPVDNQLGREALDVVELVAHVVGDGPVDVLAYSYGAVVALYAMAHLGLPARRAVVYEPPMNVPDMFPGSIVEDVERLVAEGKPSAAGRRFVRDTFFLSDATVDRWEGTPMWDVLVAAAPTLPAEFDAIGATAPEDFAGLAAPVRVLVQEEGGNPAFREVAERLVAALDHAEAAYISGVPHFAMASHPDEFVALTLDFLG